MVILLLLPFAVMGKTIICDENGIESGDCHNSTIDCGEVDECTVYCDARIDLNVTVDERDIRSCNDATINCTGANHCVVHCTANPGDHACERSNILCSNDCIVNASSSYLQSPNSSTVLHDATIDIPEHSNSSILCMGFDACSFARIVVEPSSILNTICKGAYACQDMDIDAHSDNISINVSCIGFSGTGYGVCIGLNINGSKGSNSSITTSCFAYDSIGACSSSTISGGQNSFITMICSHNYYDGGWSACYPANIIGGSGSHINVSCTDYAQCRLMKIDGRNAASLTLGDCSGNVECQYMTIWCPQQVNGEKRCDLGKGDNLQSLYLYAVNSWNDVELTTPLHCSCATSGPGTSMHCGEDYNDEWYMCHPCDGLSSGCNVEQQPNEFTTCCQPAGVPTPAPHSESHSKSHLSTDVIVIIVVGSVCFVIATVILVLMVRKKKTGRNPEAIPMSEESDAFMQSDNH